MMLSSGCRIYHHHHHHHHHHHLLGFSTSLCNNNNNNNSKQRHNNINKAMLTLLQVSSSSSSSSSSSLLIPSPPPPPPSSKPRFFRLTNNNNNNNNNKAASSSSSITDDFTGVSSFLTNTPRVSNSFSNSIAAEDAWDPPPQKLSPVAGGIVALGKFDALHIGHRELAIQAAKIGVPFLMSFVGMAEVLGWEPRAPIVAKCDRERVLSSWAPLCGNLTPKEFQVEFSKVRYLTPQQFVEKLSHELGVRGVVAGQNYRFGFKAAGDASDLLQLCNEYDMKAFIINSVMDKNQDLTNELSTNSNEKGQVSSTRVRHALAKGDMNYVSELLGRHHRLILEVKKDKMIFKDQKKFSAPRSCLLNLPPKEGIYTNCSLFIGDEIMAPCRVIIDTSDIHLELDDLAPHINISAQDFESLGVDFGESIL